MMKILRGWLFSGAVAYKRYTKPSIIRTIRDTVILLYENNLLDNTQQYSGDTQSLARRGYHPM